MRIADVPLQGIQVFEVVVAFRVIERDGSDLAMYAAIAIAPPDPIRASDILSCAFDRGERALAHEALVCHRQSV